MQTVNMLQAKSSLSRLVEAIEQGEEREIVITRNGRPAAQTSAHRNGTIREAAWCSKRFVRGAGQHRCP
jgi:antitoxin (DNA-binding transcriptional repressor) of toxin-antitoxin stability system